MLILPPSEAAIRTDRRNRDRRVTDRRKATAKQPTDAAEEVTAASQAEPDDARVEPVSGPQFRTRGRNGGRRKSDRDPVGPEATASMSGVSKPHAPLVAQLIATALNLEQTRARRRGSVKDAAALYGRIAERAKPPRGEA